MTEPSRERLQSNVVPRLLQDLLQQGQPVRLELTGHSMTPFIRRGDLVTIAPCPAHRLQLGDIVACAVGAERVVVHRIVGRMGDLLLLRGDVAPTADPPIRRDEVLGLVTLVERGGRRVRLGRGPERRVVAWLSRSGLLRGLARLRARLKGGGAAGTPPSAAA